MYVPKLNQVGDLKAKLCVVLGYHVGTGKAFVNFRGFSGNATVLQNDIQKAGWTELAFGNFLVADIVQRNGLPIAVNIREAVYPQDWE